VTVDHVIQDPPATPRAADRSLSRTLTVIYRQRAATLLVALGVVVVIMTSINPRFISASNVQDILMNVAILAIVAVGQTFVVLTKNIDLSVGACIAFSAFIAGDYLRDNPSTPILVILLISSLVGLLLGLINGALVTLGGLPSVVATLGTLYVFRGVVALMTEGPNSINAFQLPERFADFGQSKLLGISVLAWIALVVVVAAAYVLRYTRTGRDMYAIGSNATAARLAGVPVNRRVLVAFALSGLLSGLCGALWAAQYLNVNSVTASGFEFIVIAAVVVGGVNIFGGSGTVVGAALGAVILISIQSGLNLLKVSPFWISAIYGAGILLAVAVDGLLSRRIRAAMTAGRHV
jgi:rhamnose transport system permease protein